MKRYITTILTLLVITVGCTLGTAAAATGTIAKASIPFEFSVGDRTYPAGNYSLAELSQNLIALYDQSGHNVGLALASVETTFEPPADSKLKFELVNGRHVLVEIWTAGESSGSVFAVKGSKTLAPQPSVIMSRNDAARGSAPRSK
jgi:hypothetical protein